MFLRLCACARVHMFSAPRWVTNARTIYKMYCFPLSFLRSRVPVGSNLPVISGRRLQGLAKSWRIGNKVRSSSWRCGTSMGSSRNRLLPSQERGPLGRCTRGGHFCRGKVWGDEAEGAGMQGGSWTRPGASGRPGTWGGSHLSLGIQETGAPGLPLGPVAAAWGPRPQGQGQGGRGGPSGPSLMNSLLNKLTTAPTLSWKALSHKFSFSAIAFSSRELSGVF